jgi:hypothetical protein
MIYVLIIGLITMMISIECYHMESLLKSDVVYGYKDIFKIEKIQKDREVLITRLNSFIEKNVDYVDEDDISKYFSNIEDFRIYYGNSYVYYDRKNDLFKLEYVLDNKYYKEECYEYAIKNGNIRYGCINYSF